MDAFKPSRTTTNKEATPLGTYLIVSGLDEPDFPGVTFCRAAIVCSAPALTRTLSEKRPGRLDGYRRLVRLSPVITVTYPYLVLKIRRKYFMVIIWFQGYIYCLFGVKKYYFFVF